MPDDSNNIDGDFKCQVHIREKRKLRAQNRKKDEFWFGLGMFGMVGWSVAVPTVIGIFAGIWIDLNWPSAHSWTLMLLLIGLILGCANAWFWINRQRKAISEERKNDSE